MVHRGEANPTAQPLYRIEQTSEHGDAECRHPQVASDQRPQILTWIRWPHSGRGPDELRVLAHISAISCVVVLDECGPEGAIDPNTWYNGAVLIDRGFNPCRSPH